MSDVSFDALVAAVHDTAHAGSALARLESAATLSAALADHGDALLNHFVEHCRQEGHTWTEIGASLGVSKQAAQKRFAGANVDRLTPRTQRVLAAAREMADDQGAAALRLDHLLLAIFTEPATIGARALDRLGVTNAALDDAVSRHTRAPGARLADAPPADQVILSTALELGHNYVGTEHILLACHRDPASVTARALDDTGASDETLRETVLGLLASNGLP